MSLPASAPLADRVRAVVEDVAAAHDAFVVGVDLRGGTGRHVVEVFAETDEGIGIDQLARLSREIGFALDEMMPAAYTLNVSSPGATKPLVLPRQYPRHVGRRVRLEVRAPVVGSDLPETGTPEGGAPTRRIEGTLDAVTAGSLTVTPDGGDAVVVAFDDLVEGRVLLPW